MYFSKVELKRSAAMNRLAVLIGGNEYRDHQILWKLFPGMEKRDFIYRREDRNGWPCYYVVSVSNPIVDDEKVWIVQSKEYAPKVQAGRRFSFSLRANPVRSKPPGREGKRGVRHDVVMAAKTRLEQDGVPKDQMKRTAELAAEEGWKWLSTRASKHGFTVEKEKVRVDGYRQHWLSRRGHEPIRFSTLDFHGVLTVEDSGRFLETLYQGLGPAKGFGCGLLMIRRP